MEVGDVGCHGGEVAWEILGRDLNGFNIYDLIHASESLREAT